MIGEMALEALLVGRQAEEPVALGQPLERHVGMVRADDAPRRLDHVGGGPEALVRAVPALVRAEVDVAVGVGPADHLLGGPDMVGIGRPDEPVGRDREGRLGRPEQRDLLVDELARRAALVDRRLGDVDRVLVGAGQEARVVAQHPVPAGDGVGADDLVQRVQPGLVVGVRDGRGQVVAGSVGHGRRMVAGRLARTVLLLSAPMPEHQREPGTRPRIAYLSYSSGEYDARSFRMARSAIAAGWDVTVYSRWHRGLPAVEERDGYRLVRVPHDWRFLVPGLRRVMRRRYRAAMRRKPVSSTPGSAPGSTRRFRFRPLERWHWWQRVREFPLQPMGWSIGLDEVAEPADIWHGMWAGSLPALARMRRKHGGRTIYDSRDVFMRSRKFARLGRPGRDVLEWAERRWARAADRVLTVNDGYAGLLEEQSARPAAERGDELLGDLDATVSRAGPHP